MDRGRGKRWRSKGWRRHCCKHNSSRNHHEVHGQVGTKAKEALAWQMLTWRWLLSVSSGLWAEWRSVVKEASRDRIRLPVVGDIGWPRHCGEQQYCRTGTGHVARVRKEIRVRSCSLVDQDC